MRQIEEGISKAHCLRGKRSNTDSDEPRLYPTMPRTKLHSVDLETD
jgi:hypothetical protein